MISRKNGFVIAAVLVTAFSLAHLFLFLNHGLNVYDEGVAVYGAARVAAGEVPYRDFWTIYAPGQFYALAGIYRAFGFSLIVGRLFTALMLVGSITAALALASRRGAGAGVVAMMLAAVWVSSFEGRTPAMPCSVFLSLVSCASLLAFVDSHRARHAALAGGLLGIAAMYRHDIGICTAVAQAAVLLLPAGARTLRERLRGLLAYAVGVAAIAVPVSAVLLWAVPVSALVEDLVIFPAKVYPAVRSLPYPLPGLQTAAFYFAPLVCVFCLARHRPGSPDVFLFSVMGLLFMGQAWVRSDVTHLFPAMLPAIVLFAVGTSDIRAIRAGPTVPRVVYMIVLVMCVLSFLRPLTFQVMNVLGLTGGAGGFVMTEGRAKGIRLPGDRLSYERLVGYLRETVPEGKDIFVGNRRHDRIAINDVMLYFLAERASATRCHELHPGMATTAECQREIVREVETAGVDTVVLGSYDSTEPNESGKSSEVRVLDEFIAANFVTVTNFGDYVVMRRK